MKHIRTADDIRRLGKIMGIWAHPDDETYLSGGIMATAVRNGQQAICVTATKGEAGLQDGKRWPAERLAEIRSEELQRALRALGVRHHVWLGYYDGCCTEVSLRQAEKKLRDIYDTYSPDTILTFGTDGWTGHPDHRSVSRWVDALMAGLAHTPRVYHVVTCAEQYEALMEVDKQFDIFFQIESPPVAAATACDICFRCAPEILDVKYQALQAMPSQTEAILSTFGATKMREALSVEAFVRAR